MLAAAHLRSAALRSHGRTTYRPQVATAASVFSNIKVTPEQIAWLLNQFEALEEHSGEDWSHVHLTLSTAMLRPLQFSRGDRQRVRSLVAGRVEQSQHRAGSAARDVVEPIVRREAFLLRRPRQTREASDLLCGTFCSVVGGLAGR